MARSSYCYCCKTAQLPDGDAVIKQQIQSLYHQHKGQYGYRRIRLALRNRGFSLNHKTIQRLMGLLQLKAIGPKKRYRSYRGEVGKVAANTLGRNFKAQVPQQKWVTDVTEFNLQGEKVYLSPVLDLYNQEVVAYQIEQRPQFGLVMKMLGRQSNDSRQNTGPCCTQIRAGIIKCPPINKSSRLTAYSRACHARAIVWITR